MPTEDTKITKTPETGIVRQDFLTQAGGEGFYKDLQDIDSALQSNIEFGEIQISRISIAQPGTPEVAGNEDGWSGGMLFDSMSREIVTLNEKPPWMIAKGVSESELKPRPFLPVVCIFRLPSEFVKWPDKDERDQGMKNFHWKDLDVQSPRVREGLWKPKGTWQGTGAPPVTEHLNILTMGLNMDASIRTNLLVNSFSRTSFRTGQKLVTSLNQHRMTKLPWWGRVYYLFTEAKKNEKNQTYYVLMFAKGPKLEDFGLRENAIEVFQNSYEQAKLLADKTSGREYQEMMINAAAFAEDDGGDHVEGGDDTGTTDDPAF